MSSPPARRRRPRRRQETEEERAVRLEMQALKEEEGRKKKQEARRLQLKELLEQEEKFAKLNSLTVLEKWRQIMRQTKVKEQIEEIQIIKGTYDRDVERRDHIIQQLDKDLEALEEQYRIAVRSHEQNIENQIKLHNERCDSIKQEFQSKVETLQSQFDEERERLQKKHQEEKDEVGGIMRAMADEFSQWDQQRKYQFQMLRDELKQRSSDDTANLHSNLDTKMEILQAQFAQASSSYVQNIEAQAAKFKIQSVQDQQNYRTIMENLKKLNKLQTQLNHWQTKMTNNIQECEERNNTLKMEKDSLAQHYQELKVKMNRFREDQAQRLVELAKNTAATIKVLQERLEKARPILTVAEMNHKLHTEQEKVGPFSNTTKPDQDEEQTEQPKDDMKAYTSFLTTNNGKLVEEWNCLDHFFKLYNKVLLDKIALEKQEQELQQENDDLKAILKQYLDGISVNQDVLSKPNPLVVVNGRINDLIQVHESKTGQVIKPDRQQVQHVVQLAKA